MVESDELGGGECRRPLQVVGGFIVCHAGQALRWDHHVAGRVVTNHELVADRVVASRGDLKRENKRFCIAIRIHFDLNVK